MPQIRQPFCPKCGVPIKSTALIPFDIQCGECRLTRRPYGVCRSAGVYDGPLKQCIHSFKYEGRRELAGVLGRFMAECADRELAEAEYDALVPVPLHRGRLRERGFNQALLLARELAKRRGWPVAPAVLTRDRGTLSQSTLSRKERLKNVRGAFAVGKRGAVRGMHLLVIDDVYTTGATADECAGILIKAGARAVDILTLARSI